MGNRKEHLKKTLGISEYPWSSDEEDQPIPSDMHLLRRQGTEPRPSVADMPGTSGQQRGGLAHTDPSPERFWSVLPVNNSSRLMPGTSDRNMPLFVSPRAASSASNMAAAEAAAAAADPRARSGLRSAAADIRRILAFRKVQGNLNSPRPPRTNIDLFAMSSRGMPRGTRNPMFTSSLSSTSQKAHQNLLKRLQAGRNTHSTLTSRLNHTSRNPPSYLDTMKMSSLLTRRPTAPAPHAPHGPHVPHAPHAPTGAGGGNRRVVDLNDAPAADREPIPPESDLAFDAEIQPPRNGDSTSNQEPIEVDTSNNTSTMSLEEEIVEIDAQDEADGSSAAETNAENAVVNADVELNQVITLDANDDTNQSQEGRREGNSADDGEQPHTVKEFNQSLLRLLECPVCLEWMEPPMAQCRRGHLVCARCRARLASCPVCRTTFSSVRNRAMEGVAEMVRYPCRHTCGREVRLRRRNAHEASCGARRYACPAPDCADRPPLPRDQLAHHFQNRHMSMLKIGRKHKFSMKVNSEQHDTWVIAALHEYFSLRVDVDIRTWGVVVYVAYIGPKCNAKNFTYEVSVVGQHNSRKLVYARATHSDLESLSLNVSRQDCFHLTLDQALNFLRVKNRHCEPDKFLDFNVEISQSEGENATQEDSDS